MYSSHMAYVYMSSLGHIAIAWALVDGRRLRAHTWL